MAKPPYAETARPTDAIIIIDQHDQIKEWDQEAEQMFGWSADDTRGRRLCDLVLSPEYSDFYLQNTRRFLKDYSSKFIHVEVEVLDRDGKSFPVQMTVTAPGIHSRREITVLIHDISILKKAESIKGLLAAIVESSEDAIASVTLNGVINSWNDKAERLFGYSSAEAIGMNIQSLIPDELWKEQRHIFLRVQAGQLIKHFETIYLRKDKQYVDINLTVSPVRDTSGEITGASIIAQDITEKKIIETDLQNYLAELKRSNQDLEDFSHIASHDLKEPLRGLSNLSSFLLEDYKDKLEPNGVKQLNQLVDMCKRMDRLISNLLYFSKLGNEKSAINICDPNEMVEDVQKMMHGLMKEKNAKIVIPSPMPSILCDSTRVVEVFRNLITNAIKYNDKKNPVVEVGFLKSAQAPHGEEKNVFYVKDNGIGIDPKDQQTIFTMFKSLQPSGDKKSSGVGLTFAKKIIERHNGRIWLESELGKGSTFYFSVPEGVR